MDWFFIHPVAAVGEVGADQLGSKIPNPQKVAPSRLDPRQQHRPAHLVPKVGLAKDNALVLLPPHQPRRIDLWHSHEGLRLHLLLHDHISNLASLQQHEARRYPRCKRSSYVNEPGEELVAEHRALDGSTLQAPPSAKHAVGQQARSRCSSNPQPLGNQAAVKLGGGNAIPKPRDIAVQDLPGTALHDSQERLNPLGHYITWQSRSTSHLGRAPKWNYRSG
jgi:hypothetical protein